MTKRKKTAVWLIIIAGIIGSVLFINFIPTFRLKTAGMNEMQGKWINVYYESEKDAALDVFNLADSEAGILADKLGFKQKQNINIYIYDRQSEMQRKKYGLIGPLLKLDWYIGDNIGTNVILTSPANPGKVHTYDENKQAVLHEIVHAYISVYNPHIRLWLTEGTALYLTNGEPFYKDYLKDMKLPSSSDIKTRNPIRFSDMGGYTFANTYIEYLEKHYGWSSVVELLKTENYQKVFGRSEEEIYNEWVRYIKNYYQ